MDEVLDILLELLDIGNLIDVGIGIVVAILGAVIAVAGYFIEYGILDDIAILAGIVMILGGIPYTDYGILLG